MTLTKKTSIALAAIAMLASQAAMAGEPFINPDWANKAWYIGAGIGQSRSTIDQARLTSSLTANGAALTSFTTDERELGYKLFLGKQMNRYFAVEGGYFDLGKPGFNATTSGGGVLNGQAGFRGVNLDLVGQLPMSDRFSLLGRVGLQYAKASTHFTGNRLFAVTDPNPTENKLNPKLGLGLEFKFSEALAMRAEVERFRLNDAVGNRGNTDLMSLSLVYKLGRPAARAAVVAVEPPPAPPPAPKAVVLPPPPPVVVAPPAPMSEKVSFSAETLFDFDKSIVKPEGKAALDDYLSKQKGMNMEVMVTVGHADAIGTDAYNQALSERRAEAVKAYLVQQGVSAERVFTEGKGESQPVADNKNAEGRSKNRRVTVEVVGTRNR